MLNVSCFMKRGALLILWIVIAALMTACPHRVPRPENALTVSTDVFAKVDQNLQKVDDINMQLLGTYWDAENGKRVADRPVDVLARNPSSLYVEVWTGFGKSAGAVASNGVHFSMLDMTNNAYYTGPATTTNLSRLLPIHIPSEDFIRVLRGGFPLSDLAPNWRATAALDWNEETGRYRLTLPTRDGGKQLVELTYPELGVAEIRVREASGSTTYLYQARAFEDHAGVSLPHETHFEWVSKQLDLVLKVEQLQINTELPPEAFQITSPSRLKQYHLDADGNVIRTVN